MSSLVTASARKRELRATCAGVSAKARLNPPRRVEAIVSLRLRRTCEREGDCGCNKDEFHLSSVSSPRQTRSAVEVENSTLGSPLFKPLTGMTARPAVTMGSFVTD